MKYLMLFLISMSFFNGRYILAQGTFKGVILDLKDSPIPYVNIGVVGKDVGTASNEVGKFDIDLFKTPSSDSIKFSSLGYSSKVFSVEEFLNKFSPNEEVKIVLEESVIELGEITIESEKYKNRIVGNTTTSKFFGTGFTSSYLGTEIGVIMKIKRGPAILKNCRFFISQNRYESITLRLNIYDLNKKGEPENNILKENIIIHKNNNYTGEVEVDLLKYGIVVEDDFFISLEWIGRKGDVPPGVAGVVISAGFLNSKSYTRITSHSKWEKLPSVGAGINVEILN